MVVLVHLRGGTRAALTALTTSSQSHASRPAVGARRTRWPGRGRRRAPCIPGLGPPPVRDCPCVPSLARPMPPPLRYGGATRSRGADP